MPEDLTGDPSDSAFWCGLLPGFSIGEHEQMTSMRFETGDGTAVREQLRASGYVHLPSACPADLAAELGAGLALLVGRGLPAVCLFLYDQPWRLLQAMAPRIEAVFGKPFLLMSNFWAWHVPNDDASTGFAVHRDYYEPLVGMRGEPLSANVWIALSEARPPGSCLYFLPAERDPNYPFNLRDTSIHTLPDVVAVPSRPGDVIIVGANVLHWGSRSSAQATTPRLSLAMQIQGKDTPPLSPQLWEPERIPGFADRRHLVASQLRQFRHHARDATGLDQIARALAV
jgi:hypothetical protein